MHADGTRFRSVQMTTRPLVALSDKLRRSCRQRTAVSESFCANLQVADPISAYRAPCMPGEEPKHHVRTRQLPGMSVLVRAALFKVHASRACHGLYPMDAAGRARYANVQ
jgi:hypothetical protein